MTELTEAAKQRACDLANEAKGKEFWNPGECNAHGVAAMFAFARELQRISDVVEEVEKVLARYARHPYLQWLTPLCTKLATITLPKPDPLERFAKWANIPRDELEIFLAKRGLEIREKQG